MSVLYLLLVGLFLTSVLIESVLINQLISIIALIALLTSFRSASWIARIVATVFLSSGFVTLISVSAEPGAMLYGFGEMVYIVTLFALLPVLSIPIRMFQYDKCVRDFFQSFSGTTNRAYFGVLSISYFLGTFLTLGTIPIVYRTVEKSVADLGIHSHRKFISISLTQGFIGPLIWTPFSGLLGVTLVVFDTSWLVLLPVLLSIGLLSTALSVLSFLVIYAKSFNINTDRHMARYEHDSPDQSAADLDRSSTKGLRELCLIVMGFILTALMLELHYQAGLVITIVFSIGPFVIIWVALKGGLKQLPGTLKSHFHGHFRSMAGTYLVFLSAGYFVNAFSVSGYNTEVAEFSGIVIQAIGTEFFVLLFPLALLFMAFMAIHPLVFLLLISSVLNSETVGLSVEGIAVTFLAGVLLNFIISPYSGTVGLMRQMTGLSGGQIILANIPTAVMTYFSFVLMIFVYYF